MDNNTTLDPQYEQKASGFLKKAIAGLVCAAFPIASIVAIFLGAGNHKDIVITSQQAACTLQRSRHAR